MTPPSTHRAPPFAVEVPASTSNIGPGFDLIGLALSLFLRVDVLGTASGAQHELIAAHGTAHSWPRDATNVLFRAFDLYARRSGLECGALAFEVHSEIPVARGLGASGAAAAAGVLIAAAIAGRATQTDLMLDCAQTVEGHPDNCTPALLGGCTLSVPTDEGLRVVRQAIHPDLAFAVAWPQETLRTAAARALLPDSVPFEAALENPRRLALLLEGLRCGDPELLRAGCHDRLHVPYRLPSIAGGAEALEAAFEAGAWLASISGSGSALFAVAGAERVESVATAMREVLGRSSARAEGRVLELVKGPARIL